MRAPLLLAALAALAVLAALSACAQTTPPPYVCPDDDTDGICDSHPTWPLCRCGNNVNCTDNCVGADNPSQFDYDCDGRGNGNERSTTLSDAAAARQREITMMCDPCLYHHNPLVQPGNVRPNRDGDPFDDACDCAPDDPATPGTNRPCPIAVENNDFVWIWILVLVVVLVFGLLVFIVIMYVRRRPVMRARTPGLGSELKGGGGGAGAGAGRRLYGTDLFGLGLGADDASDSD